MGSCHALASKQGAMLLETSTPSALSAGQAPVLSACPHPHDCAAASSGSPLHFQGGLHEAVTRQAPATSLHYCSSLGPPAVLLQTLTSLRTFKSAGIHCPSAYIITSLAMVFLELRERQAQRERVADKGDHLAAGLQRKASLIPIWHTTV